MDSQSKPRRELDQHNQKIQTLQTHQINPSISTGKKTIKASKEREKGERINKGWIFFYLH